MSPNARIAALSTLESDVRKFEDNLAVSVRYGDKTSEDFWAGEIRLLREAIAFLEKIKS